jgi:glycosyltransferase involved in cell wall biosynthesis
MSSLTIIIPCYGSELNIGPAISALRETEALFPPGTEVDYILVDDGSPDRSLEEIMKVRELYPNKITGVKLTRNFGSSAAVLAGMSIARGDCCAFISADLQDPPELLPKMFSYWQSGIKVVIANRENREEPWSQAIVSNFMHWLIRRFGVQWAPTGGFDLLLFDREIVLKLRKSRERNIFLPYLIAWMGYDYVNIPYTRRKRVHGKSQHNFARKLKIAIDLLVAFSFFPIRMISICGFIFGLCALIYSSVIIFNTLAGHGTVTGWASTMVVVLFSSSFQMIALGVIGEYLWRTIENTRGRPAFIIDKVFD